MITLGQYIRTERDKKDFSLREFAKKINCSPAFLSDIELGRRHPSNEVFAKIAEQLGVSISKLKEYDTRPATEELRELSQLDPRYAFAFRTVIENNVSAEKLIELAKNESKKKK